MSIGVRIPSIRSLSPGIPPLEQGDHLSRDEFERRFDATPGLTKAELIDGVVQMAPAVRWENHATPHADLVACLVFYRAATPGVSVGDNGSFRLDIGNEPQPDVAMLIDPSLGGQAKISADDYIEGAPELVAEVAASSVSIDLNSKLRVYRRNGVREYIVWRVRDAAMDHFILRDAGYDLVPTTADGILRSEQFPGLWIDTAALMRGDIAGVLSILQQGLTSAEHADFVAKLKSRGGSDAVMTRAGIMPQFALPRFTPGTSGSEAPDSRG